MKKLKYTLAILAAGCLWGFMGLFTRNLYALGFDAPGALIVRCGIAAVLFAVLLLFKDPKLFRIRLRDLWCFLGVGLCSLLFFTWCYFQCIKLTSLSMAAVLLYTAPSIVMVLSLFLFREKLTVTKVVALLLAFAGCCLVSGLGGGEVNVPGILFGLGAGLGYALYSIFARFALLRGYDSRTINFYAMFIGTLGAVVIWGGGEPLRLMTSSLPAALWCVATGLFSCFLPYLLYTYGLSGTETGKAAVMASTEPVVATLVGAVLFDERLTVRVVLGVALVLLAIAALNLRQKQSSPEKAE
ncbi:MAG: EamA family transporter [Oscillospiraceae bacterium]|nr:EamA family transporter [Oscillospiraceae bacterium]